MNGGSSLQAVVQAVSVLECEPLTNAGFGSNLNKEGQVECDACVASGCGLSGSVAALSGIPNPIQVASSLLTDHLAASLPLGLVRPIFMCGEGARTWAIDKGDVQSSLSLSVCVLCPGQCFGREIMFRFVEKAAGNALLSVDRSENRLAFGRCRGEVGSMIVILLVGAMKVWMRVGVAKGRT